MVTRGRGFQKSQNGGDVIYERPHTARTKVHFLYLGQSVTMGNFTCLVTKHTGLHVSAEAAGPLSAPASCMQQIDNVHAIICAALSS